MHSKRTPTILLTFLALASALPGQSSGQCILANPSFEIEGSGGNIFGGWEQFGLVGSVTEATHGGKAARASGPDSGTWEVSGFWQQLDCDEGEQWAITGHVMHPSENPLTGQCNALVNVEWRNAGGELIDYDTFSVADASSPPDEYIDFSLISTPAPTGTVAARLLLGVLQSPSDPPPDAYFDQATFYSTTPPTIDDMQWNDFPGGRSVEFADRTWLVKGPGWFGPGPSNYCHLPSCVWVDDDQRLHLTIKFLNSTWNSTEVVLEDALGFGDYIFTTRGAIDQLDVHAVLGLFLWQYGPCYDAAYLWWNPFNEIDIEISRWGNPGNDVGQFVAQPWDWPGNVSRYDANFIAEELSSHAFNWLPDRVEFRSWRGGPLDESTENMIHEWTYTGPHIPRPEQPRVHMNLWQFASPPATDQEVVMDDFTFIPAEEPTDVEDPSDGSVPPMRAGRLYPAVPNPFNPSTSIRYFLPQDGIAKVSIYEVSGALVKTLVDEVQGTGEHEITWNGRDGEGALMSSGIYLCTLQFGDGRTTQRLALIK